MQQVAHVEREKEDFRTQLSAAKKQLEEASNLQTKTENKLSKLQQQLRAANEEKANLEAKLVQKQMALSGVEDALKIKSDDFNMLKEKYKSLESQLNSVSDQRAQCEVSYFTKIYVDFFPNLKTPFTGTFREMSSKRSSFRI